MTVLVWRPRTRRDCEDGPRPCPWLSCRHHLVGVESGMRRALRRCNPMRRREWNPAAKRWLPLAPEECEERVLALVAAAEHTCALDVVDEHPNGMTLLEIGEVLGFSRQRAEQEVRAALEAAGDVKVKGAL